jgi:Uncharacterized protein conserved in bacteria (DUF2333)
MENTPNPDPGEKQTKGFKLFAAKRIVAAAIAVVLLLWLVHYGLSFFEATETGMSGHTPQVADMASSADTDTADHTQTASHESTGAVAVGDHGSPEATTHSDAADTASHAQTAPHAAGETADMADHTPAGAATNVADAHTSTAPQNKTDTAGDHDGKVGHAAKATAEDAPHAPAGHGAFSASGVTGVAFVEATIAPLRYELEERYYGWRPNDIADFTDNVNNYQLGVLEVTRRTVEVLLERISSTGGSQTFDKDLELARNNLMIKASDYMLPSAEDSYEEALESLSNYRGKLLNGTAFFYGRIDNLIPLLRAYENLLGSCDDKLIRHYEDDGSEVSWFSADDYFYYAKGAASTMHSILEAVAVDFATAIETRRGTEILHHALEALHHATQIDPILILDSAPDGIMANHRANMAAPISHARFFVGLLIETLST